MNVLAGGPASASVQVISPSRLLVISGAMLRRLANRDSDFRILLENGMSRDTRRKLMQANHRLTAPMEREALALQCDNQDENPWPRRVEFG